MRLSLSSWKIISKCLDHVSGNIDYSALDPEGICAELIPSSERDDLKILASRVKIKIIEMERSQLKI